MTWVIETEGLGRSFAGHDVLADISLRIGEGEIFGLLGADGSGKTTLMQMFAAILDPTRGSCRVLGLDSVKQSATITARIGYMSQGFTLYDRLSVDENLEFAAHVRGVVGETYRRRRTRLLAMAGLARFGARRSGALSGGMRKKLSLCTNLIHEPPLLLLDEMSLGVDPLSRRELWAMLSEFRAAGATVVITTPYMDEALRCDRLALLESGRVLAVNTPAALRERVEGTVFELVPANSEQAQELLAERTEILAAQWVGERLRIQLSARDALSEDLLQRLRSIGELSPISASLTDVFVQMAGKRVPIPLSPGLAQQAQPPATDTVLVENVTYRFGDFTAVDNVSLRVRAGEVFGFLGPNGAGKTTLIRAMCGLLRPASGRLRIAGIDVAREPMRLRNRIGYMSQRFSLYADLTVRENLVFFAGVYGLGTKARSDAIDYVRAMTALEGMEYRQVEDLSGAMRQRLALACSVLHRPAVLFLDEPTSGIDPRSRQRFWQLIRALARSGITVFVTTHYLEEATYCDRLALMFEGRLVAVGSIPQLRTALAAPETATMEDIFMGYIERERTREAEPREAVA